MVEPAMRRDMPVMFPFSLETEIAKCSKFEAGIHAEASARPANPKDARWVFSPVEK